MLFEPCYKTEFQDMHTNVYLKLIANICIAVYTYIHVMLNTAERYCICIYVYMCDQIDFAYDIFVPKILIYYAHIHRL